MPPPPSSFEAACTPPTPSPAVGALHPRVSLTPSSVSRKPLPSLVAKPSGSAGRPFIKPAALSNGSSGRAHAVEGKTAVAGERPSDGKENVSAPVKVDGKEERRLKRVKELKERVVSTLSHACCEPHSVSSILDLLLQCAPDEWVQPSHLEAALDELVKEAVLGTTTVSLPPAVVEDEWILAVQPLLPEAASSAPPTVVIPPTTPSRVAPVTTGYETPVSLKAPLVRASPSTPSTNSSGPSSSHHPLPVSGGGSAARGRLGVRRRYPTSILSTPNRPTPAPTLPPPSTPPPSAAPPSPSPSAALIEQKRQSALQRLAAQPSSVSRERARVDAALADARRAIERIHADRAKPVDERETLRVEQLRMKWLHACQSVLEDLLRTVQRGAGEGVSMLQLLRGLGVDSDMVQYDAAREEFKQ